MILNGKINLGNFSFLSTFYSNVSYNDTYDAQFLTELVGVRDSEYQVVFSDNIVTFLRQNCAQFCYQLRRVGSKIGFVSVLHFVFVW